MTRFFRPGDGAGGARPPARSRGGRGHGDTRWRPDSQTTINEGLVPVIAYPSSGRESAMPAGLRHRGPE
jgi:hypothetical protein